MVPLSCFYVVLRYSLEQQNSKQNVLAAKADLSGTVWAQSAHGTSLGASKLQAKLLKMVLEGGVEPPRGLRPHRILSPARLPVPPLQPVCRGRHEHPIVASFFFARIRAGHTPVKKKIGGVELAWEEAGTGLPVVLLHAFPLNRRMWKRQQGELASRYRVITPDFRGHGQSSLPGEDSTMERLAADIRSLLDALGLKRVVLGGLSMGGYAAFAFFLHYPERVAALILADTRPQADTEEGRQARHELARVAENEGSTLVADRMLPKLLAPSTRERQPAVVAAVREMILSTPPAGIARALRGMAARPDSTELLPAIKCPTLVLVGQEDALTPPAVAEAMAKKIPGAQLEVIPGAGHLSNLEQPARFTRLLDHFLARVPAP